MNKTTSIKRLLKPKQELAMSLKKAGQAIKKSVKIFKLTLMKEKKRFTIG